MLHRIQAYCVFTRIHVVQSYYPNLKAWNQSQLCHMACPLTNSITGQREGDDTQVTLLRERHTVLNLRFQGAWNQDRWWINKFPVTVWKHEWMMVMYLSVCAHVCVCVCVCVYAMVRHLEGCTAQCQQWLFLKANVIDNLGFFFCYLVYIFYFFIRNLSYL